MHLLSLRQLAGIVVASLCWKNKEWVGLSLVCGIDSIFKTMSSHVKRSLSSLDWHKLDGLDLPFHDSKSSDSSLSIMSNEKGIIQQR